MRVKIPSIGCNTQSGSAIIRVCGKSDRQLCPSIRYYAILTMNIKFVPRATRGLYVSVCPVVVHVQVTPLAT